MAWAEWGKSTGHCDRRLKRDVAIKVLPETISRDAERLIRFQREAEILASLNHPTLRPFTDSRNVDIMPGGQHFIAAVDRELSEGTPAQINVVLNWSEELKQRVPANQR